MRALGFVFLLTASAVQAAIPPSSTAPAATGDEANGLLSSASVSFAKGDLDGAVASLSLAVEKDPGLYRAWLLLAECRFVKGQHLESKAAADKAVALAPAAPEPLHLRGAAAIMLGAFDSGIEDYRRALKLSPEYLPARTDLGAVLLKRGELNEATEAFQEAVNLAPDNVNARLGLGSALFKRKKYKEAAKVLEEAVRLSPTNAGAQMNLGVSYFKAGEWQAAANALNWAVSLEPKNAQARFNLGQAYLKLEDRKGAEEQRKALEPLDASLSERLGRAFR